jgi:integrative and conjugative element protein (TIGR02256 family)
MFAAASAGVFTQHHASPLARCLGYVLSPVTMALEAVAIEATEPISMQSNGWTIRYDEKLTDQMRAMSHIAAPNETGGVLFGVLDRERTTCSVVLASASPPDSEEWPNAYIRGAEGLKALVDDVATITAGQLHYVGEWHSHPPGCSNNPSDTDGEALRILTEIMGQEGLPAIAFIIGKEPTPWISVGC